MLMLGSASHQRSDATQCRSLILVLSQARSLPIARELDRSMAPTSDRRVDQPLVSAAVYRCQTIKAVGDINPMMAYS